MELVKKKGFLVVRDRIGFLAKKYDGRESKETVFCITGELFCECLFISELAQKKFVQLKNAPNNVGVNRTTKVVASSKCGKIVCPPLGGPLFFPFDLSHNTRLPTKRKRSPSGHLSASPFLFLFPLSLRTLAPMISQRRRRRNSPIFGVFHHSNN